MYQQCYRFDKEKASDKEFEGTLTLSVNGIFADIHKSSMKLNFKKRCEGEPFLPKFSW